ncbi:MAG: hypothetical protein H6927_17750 [Burkholderiaceae bacterium]|nr:hypothetical protein [Pseudomonadota bacterium]MBS0597792.1 hypothetical protein [Pseudomonadota bacterium]MCO5117456.1 hypothetical protein [Burkholderiaceae bacterium]MCP5219928.1 hypothetical protein [Burkholderiaceae bacterium]
MERKLNEIHGPWLAMGGPGVACTKQRSLSGTIEVSILMRHTCANSKSFNSFFY